MSHLPSKKRIIITVGTTFRNREGHRATVIAEPVGMDAAWTVRWSCEDILCRINHDRKPTVFMRDVGPDKEWQVDQHVIRLPKGQ